MYASADDKIEELVSDNASRAGVDDDVMKDEHPSEDTTDAPSEGAIPSVLPKTSTVCFMLPCDATSDERRATRDERRATSDATSDVPLFRRYRWYAVSTGTGTSEVEPPRRFTSYFKGQCLLI